MRKNIMQKIKCKTENIVRRIEELKSEWNIVKRKSRISQSKWNTTQGRGKKIGVIIVLVLIWSVSLTCMYAENVENDIADSVVRLHILANSNSDEDQQLKLEVRDYLLGYMREEMEGEALPSAEMLSGLAEEFVKTKGKDYEVRAEYCKTYFPTKEYNNVKFPAGQYNALRVLIGEGAGENWWCVMYPPLCMTNAYEGGLNEESQEMLQGEMSEEGYALINAEAEGENEFKIKFKVVEWYGEIKEYISGLWGR